MYLTKRAFRVGLILLMLLVLSMAPTYAIDQVTCGNKETGGSGNGKATVDCTAPNPSKIWVYSNDFLWGSHWATGRLNKEFTTSTGGTYRIFIYGEAYGLLSLVFPTGIPIVDPADGSAAIDVYAKVYEKNSKIIPNGGQEISVLSRSIDDWGDLPLKGEPFQNYFDVDLKPNTKYIVELKAKASTSAAGAQSAQSAWGMRSRPQDCIEWKICEITPPEPDPTCSLEYVVDLINQWENDEVDLGTVVAAINHWASSECVDSSGLSQTAVKKQKQKLLKMLQQPLDKLTKKYKVLYTATCRPNGLQAFVYFTVVCPGNS